MNEADFLTCHFDLSWFRLDFRFLDHAWLYLGLTPDIAPRMTILWKLPVGFWGPDKPHSYVKGMDHTSCIIYSLRFLKHLFGVNFCIYWGVIILLNLHILECNPQLLYLGIYGSQTRLSSYSL